jgi:hypothetical protein
MTMSSQRGAALKAQKKRVADARARTRAQSKAQAEARQQKEREYTEQALETQLRLRREFYARNPHLRGSVR